MSGTAVTSDLIKPPDNANRAPGTSKRMLYRILPDEKKTTVQAGEENATMVGSRLEMDRLGHRHGLHAPAVDLDVPAYLIPSSTPGHSHLYIDVEIPWWRYRILLWALALARVIEPGYYKASVKKKASMLRRPGVLKLTPDQEEQEAIASIKTAIRRR